MASVFGIFVAGIFALIGAVISVGFITAGAAQAVNGVRNGRRRQAIFGLLLSFGTVLAIVLFLCRDNVIPLNIQAKSLMSLPPGADVIAVEHGDWGGDGSVTFRLPANKPVNSWFTEIWHLNHSEYSLPVTKAKYQWDSRNGGETRDLTYNPATGEFTYYVELNG